MERSEKTGIIQAMDTKQKLDQALKDALRSGNEPMKRTVRLVRSSIKLDEVSRGRELDEAEVIAVIQKEIKIHQESLEEARKGNRADLVKDNETDIEILEDFLPKQLTDEELQEMASAAVAEVGANSMSDMGKVMKALLPQIQGRAANDRVSLAVRKVLNS